MICEIYELKPEDLEALEDLKRIGYNDPDARRTLGLQSRDEIIEDKKLLKNYQAKLRSHPDGK